MRRAKKFLVENGYDIKGMTEQDVLDKVDEVITYSKEDRKDPKDLQKMADDTEETVQGYDQKGDPVTVTPEDEELTEEQIEEMVRESQNPIMSKEDLMEEITRQLVTEDNAYEGELESGDNPYSKHFFDLFFS